MDKLFNHKWVQRGRGLALTLLIVLAMGLFLNSMISIEITEAQSGRDDSDTIYRGNLRVNGRLLTFGPAMIGPGGTIGIYNSDGDMVSGIDAYGNITATGSITAAGFSSDDLVRGYDDSQAHLVGSLAVTTTITGTAVVSTGPYALRGGSCSLAMVPTTTLSYCAIDNTAGGGIQVIVYQSNGTVATLPAPLTWFAFVEPEE